MIAYTPRTHTQRVSISLGPDELEKNAIYITNGELYKKKKQIIFICWLIVELSKAWGNTSNLYSSFHIYCVVVLTASENLLKPTLSLLKTDKIKLFLKMQISISWEWIFTKRATQINLFHDDILIEFWLLDVINP